MQQQTVRTSQRVSRFIASWGVDRPFANLAERTQLAQNIGEIVSLLLYCLVVGGVTWDLHHVRRSVLRTLCFAFTNKPFSQASLWLLHARYQH